MKKSICLNSKKRRSFAPHLGLCTALFLAMMLFVAPARCEEAVTLGDYIYIPERSQEASGGETMVRVRGVALPDEEGEGVIVEALSGVTLGVYVQNARGEMTPWANPLSPLEPLRVVTSSQETALNLPSGGQFYLRVEAVPEGYIMPEDGFYPIVAGETVQIACTQPAQVIVEIGDVTGGIYAQTGVALISQDGTRMEAYTDENGTAVFSGLMAGTYTVEELETPEGALALAQSALTVELSQAQRARVSFVHPQLGRIRVMIVAKGVDEKGAAFERSLKDANVYISNEAGELVAQAQTDETGAAEMPLEEGVYILHIEAPDEAYALLLTDAMAQVQNGMTTPVEINAIQNGGRIVLTLTGESTAWANAQFTFTNAQGEMFGPYRADEEGCVVTQLLTAGAYTVQIDALAQDARADETISTSEGEISLRDGTIVVADGQSAQAALALRTVQTQIFTLLGATPGAGEEMEETPLAKALVWVIDESGDLAAECTTDENAQATLSLLGGTYTLRVQNALEEGFAGTDTTVQIPSTSESVRVVNRMARLEIACVDEQNARLSGAQLRITDATGKAYVLDTDENGRVLSSLMEPGEARVEVISAPEGYAIAQSRGVTLESGQTVQEQIAFIHQGIVRLRVEGKTASDAEETINRALPGVTVDVLQLREGADALDVNSYDSTPYSLTTDAQGAAEISLKAGMYLLRLREEGLDARYDAEGCAAFVNVVDGGEIDAVLTAAARAGGVSVTFTDEALTSDQLSQIRLSLVDDNGVVTPLEAVQDRFVALEMEKGLYTLTNDAICEGYSPLEPLEIEVTGGEMTQLYLTLEEHARLSIDRRGVTFDENLQSYVLPISGLYGVYVLEDGEYVPYTQEDEPLYIAANDAGEAGTAILPATMQGTVYYLKEVPGDSTQGYVTDTQYHEVTLHAGENVRTQLSATADKGFFRLENVDADSLSPLTGAQFALYRLEAGEVAASSVLTFTMEEASYQNTMALPVGDYRIKILKAAPGYALDARMTDVYADFSIVPYLSKGGTVTQVRIESAAQPHKGEGTALKAFVEASGEDVTLRIADVMNMRATPSGVHLFAQLQTDEGVYADVRQITLGRIYSESTASARYGARVVYALYDGGWQLADMRTVTGLETGEVNIDLSNAQGVVTSVAVYYFDVDTGLETLAPGTIAGDVTLRAHMSGALEAQIVADISLIYQAECLDEAGENSLVMQEEATARALCNYVGDTLSQQAVSEGVDGVIAGTIFEDENGDGLCGIQETRRAGVKVALLSKDAQGNWSVYDTTQSDEQGAYRFADLPMGAYTLQVELPEDAMFTSALAGEIYLSSAITDTGFGQSEEIAVDPQHTSHIANAGIIRIARVRGTITLLDAQDEARLLSGAYISLRGVGQEKDDAVYVSTGEDGSYLFDRLAPGEYILTFDVPTGSAIASLGERFEQEGQDARSASALFTLDMGQQIEGMDIELERVGEISGLIFVDEDYDGIYGGEESTLAGTTIELIRYEGEKEIVCQETTSAEDGTYIFESVRAGTYSLRMTLPERYVFTRAGTDSQVSGAVGHTGETERFILERGARAQGINAGATIPASLTVSVWQDTTFDGIRASSEKGLEGAEIALVRLNDGEAGERMTGVTDETGIVYFEAVSPGNYQVEYVLPDIWRATVRRDAQNASDVNASTLPEGVSDPFVLLMGETEASLSIGAVASCTIGGCAFADSDDNGLFDAGETGRENVMVELLSSADQEVLYQMYTDEQGAYAFEGIAPGRYRVRFTAAQGDVFSGTDLTRAKGCAPYSDENVSTTDSVTVNAGGKLTQINAGIVTPSVISGTIFVDANDDGERTGDENGLEGAVITLSTRQGRTTGVQVTTGTDGIFHFTGVRPGSYTLRIALPDDYVFSSELASSLVFAEHGARSSLTNPFTLTNGETLEDLSFGALTQGAIGGVVFADRDFDGMRGEAESGVRGVVVELLSETGDTQVKTTGADGAFRFDALMPGTYRLRVTLPDGMVYTKDGVSLLGRSDERTQQSEAIELEMGEKLDALLIGVLSPAQVSGRAWMDADNDGRRDSDEESLMGVEVTLYRVEDAAMEPTETVVTDEEGRYSFTGVLPGNYVVGVQLQDGYAFARKVSGTSRVSVMPMENARSAFGEMFELTAGKEWADCDIGVVRVGTITGNVYLDADYDGMRGAHEEGIEGTAIELLSQDGTLVASVLSGPDGGYALENVRVGTYMLRFTLPDDKVFTCSLEQSLIAQTDEIQASSAAFTFAMGEERTGCDVGAIDTAQISARIFTDNNFSNAFDEDEYGVGRAVVELINDGTVVATYKTDANGAVSFTRLRPGTYKLRIALPSECLFTHDARLNLASSLVEQEETEEAAETVVDEGVAAQGETDAFNVQMGGDYAFDYPAIYTNSVSGFAFEDENVNGLYDQGESPLSGTLIELLALEDNEWTVVASAQAGEEGTYRFTYLWPGQYAVRFTLPEGYLFTQMLLDGDPARNSDAYAAQGRTAQTGEFTLHTGEKAEHADVGAIRPACLGDTVFIDENENGWLDFGEKQPEGIELTLYKLETDGTRTQAAQQTTDRYGYYRFDDLRPGRYVLSVALPEGYAFTEPHVGGFEEIDSDITIWEDGWGETDVFTLASGEIKRNCDVGLTKQ